MTRSFMQQPLSGLVTSLASLILLCSTNAQGSHESDPLTYLKALSIEDLLQIQVTSVSKRPESLFDAAAAVTVITQDDIRRTGARSIPEVLRIVPGLQVRQIDSSRWEIGARGFNGLFENKLLVLMDGRSLYNPLFAGVNWNTLDTVLEDIDRIEVIRGPGATIWGANAVNGVINIITKDSRETQGGLVSAVYGNNEQPLVSARYGGKIGEQTAYRFYAKGFEREPYEDSAGNDAHDSWNTYRAGVRADSDLSDHTSISFQAEYFQGEADVQSRLSGFLTPPFVRESGETEDFQGGHVQLNFKHILSETSVIDINAYYDGYTKDLVVAEEDRDTFDLEGQYQFSPWQGHNVVWGAGVRWTEDEIDGTFFTSFDPASKDYVLWSAFLQDDIEIIKDNFWITLGSKFEHNDFSGFEVQPSIRFRYKPAEKHLFWAALSRAVRTPSRSEQDIVINLATFSRGPGNLSQLRLLGNDKFDSEELLAYELGYRWYADEKASLDIATFYNDYDDLRSLQFLPVEFEFNQQVGGYLVMPETFTNELEGKAYGVEITGSWQLLTKLRMSASYSWIDLDLDLKNPAHMGDTSLEQNFPRHQLSLTTYYDPLEHVSVGAELYYVDEYESDSIDDYLRVDLQVTWEPLEWLELSVGGENLFDSRHKESEVSGGNVVASEVPSIYWVKGVFRF